MAKKTIQVSWKTIRVRLVAFGRRSKVSACPCSTSRTASRTSVVSCAKHATSDNYGLLIPDADRFPRGDKAAREGVSAYRITASRKYFPISATIFLVDCYDVQHFGAPLVVAMMGFTHLSSVKLSSLVRLSYVRVAVPQGRRDAQKPFLGAKRDLAKASSTCWRRSRLACPLVATARP